MKWRLIAGGVLALLLLACANSPGRAALFLHGSYNPSVGGPPVPTQIAPATCPNVLDNTAANTAVCPLTITTSDGSAFTGTVYCINSALFTIPGCTGTLRVSSISPTALTVDSQTPQGTVFQFYCTMSDKSPCVGKNWTFSNVPAFLTPGVNWKGGTLTVNQAPPLPTNSGNVSVSACDASEAGCASQSLPPVTAPCDIYASTGFPCVAAYSTVRALYGSYNGPLYQVQRASDGTLLDVGLLAAGGIVNTAPEDAFCASTSCSWSIIYDQSQNINNMIPVMTNSAPAQTMPITVAGHKAYGIYESSQYINTFSDRGAVGTQGSDAPGTDCTVARCAQEVYMVSSGQFSGPGSGTYDFGTAENEQIARGFGTIHSLSWGTLCWVFEGCNLQGSGPWLAIDLEGAVFYSDDGTNKDPADTGLTSPFVTLMSSVDGVATFNRKGGNARSGGLTTWYSGSNPVVNCSIFSPTTPCPTCFKPLHLEGGIILGTGGDGVSGQPGVFFEGAITRGQPPDTVDNAIQANVVAAGYTSIP